MTKQDFDLIMDLVIEKTEVSCPDNFRILIWAQFNHYDAHVFATKIVETITAMRMKDQGFFKHVNS